MKIAILSDSHGRIDKLKKLFIFCKNEKIKNVIHAGDFLVDGAAEIFADFGELNFFIARGNCDVDAENWQKIKNQKNILAAEILHFLLEKINFAASHVRGIAQNFCRAKKIAIDVFVHGHTHRAEFAPEKNFFVLNPGSLADDGSFLIFDTTKFLQQKNFLQFSQI